MGEQENVALVKRGFEAFNAADVATLSDIIAADAVQHMPGSNPFSGDHKGRDDILGMYGQIGEASAGTFRAELDDVRADGPDKVVATYQSKGERGGKSLGTKNTITFQIRDGKIVDIADAPDDQAAWDDFWS
jgi:ketosteroid isomerase-like protein